jgi:hypothetical protein
LDQFFKGKVYPWNKQFYRHTQFGGHTTAVVRIRFVEVDQLAGNDTVRYALLGLGEIGE